jgi:hypothetical protein
MLPPAWKYEPHTSLGAAENRTHEVRLRIVRGGLVCRRRRALLHGIDSIAAAEEQAEQDRANTREDQADQDDDDDAAEAEVKSAEAHAAATTASATAIVLDDIVAFTAFLPIHEAPPPAFDSSPHTTPTAVAVASQKAANSSW